MSTELLTNAALRAMVDGDLIWDVKTSNLAARRSGDITAFVVQYRIGRGRKAKRRRVTLGRWTGQPSGMTLTEARAEAAEWLRKARGGRDPAGGDTAPDQAENGPITFSHLCDIYLTEKAGNKSIYEDRRRIEKDGGLRGRFGEMDVTAVKSSMIAKMKTEHAEKHVEFNRVRSLLVSMFNIALPYFDGALGNPATLVKKYPEKARDRVLSDDEIRWVWKACERIGDTPSRFAQVALLTGQRRGEVSAMHASEINDDVWHLKGDRTKNGKDHDVPLTGVVLDLLSECDGYLFPGRGGRRPIGNFNANLNHLREVVQEIANDERGEHVDIERWTYHDFRRTLSTGLQRLGYSREVRDAVTNHTPLGIDAIYSRHGFVDEKREALEAWTSHVTELVN